MTRKCIKHCLVSRYKRERREEGGGEGVGGARV